jgi:hypothetical protein
MSSASIEKESFTVVFMCFAKEYWYVGFGMTTIQGVYLPISF